MGDRVNRTGNAEFHAHVYFVELKVRAAKQVCNVFEPPRHEVIQAYNLITSRNQGVTQMGTKKTGSSSYNGAHKSSPEIMAAASLRLRSRCAQSRRVNIRAALAKPEIKIADFNVQFGHQQTFSIMLHERNGNLQIMHMIVNCAPPSAVWAARY